MSDMRECFLKLGHYCYFLNYYYLYLHKKYHVILPKTKVKKSQMSTFILKKEREAGGNMPRERNHIEENRKETKMKESNFFGAHLISHLPTLVDFRTSRPNLHKWLKMKNRKTYSTQNQGDK